MQRDKKFEFETPRLHARKIDAADVEAMLRVYGDPEVVRWVGDGLPLDRALCEKWVEVTHRNYATRGYGMLALVERASGAVVGFGGLVHPGGKPEAEIKYALHRRWWGQGFATEAAAALLAYGASQFGLSEIIATAAPENEASHRVLLKAGMQRGELRRNEDGTFTQFFAWSKTTPKGPDAMQISIILRDYRSDDWPAICRVHDRSRPDELRGSFDPRAFIPLAQDPEGAYIDACTMFVAQEGDAVVGFAGIDEPYLAWLYVDPAHYRRGIGRTLLRHCLARLSEEAWTLACGNNDAALRLYLSEGFVIESRFLGENAGYKGPAARLALHPERQGWTRPKKSAIPGREART